ncbi:hypothetical protein [Pseudothermotoga thermarum]|uniref:hypothetical protein n=1 Tax=Pseudothermotoga thermarum TaxID=119394 RepID=UPI00031BA7FD|nr:hypothetical protein [Pseudothermotoga thermarum]
MSKLFQQVLKVLFKHGYYAKPLVIYGVKFSERDEQYFLKTVVSDWKDDVEKSIQTVEKGLRYARSLTIKYLLLAKKLSVLIRTGNDKTEKLLRELKDNFSNIPPIARKLIITIVTNNFYDGKTKTYIRTWGRKYFEDPSAVVFIKIAQARKYYRESKISMALHELVQAYKIANKIPHPTAMIAALNNAAWYIKNKHPLIALKFSKECIYTMGWYRELEEASLYSLDINDTVRTDWGFLSNVSDCRDNAF